MKIKLDENLPVRLGAILQKLGHDVDSVTQENLSGQRDLDIWNAAQRERRFLITQDLDFSDVRRFVPGTHFVLLLVRLRSPDRQSLIQRVRDVFEHEGVESWTGCFVVITERKLRVRARHS